MVPLVFVPSGDVRGWGRGKVSGETCIHIQSKERDAYTKEKLNKANQG